MKSKNEQSGTPLMRQYMEIKSQYSDCIVLFRMGDFYETFSEDAKTTSKVLGIVLTKRANGAAADVPLAGFPHHAIDNYLPKLVSAGYRVAICEQVEDPKLAKGIVKREVIEVVTPGTLTSDQALHQKSNQYIASLMFHRNIVGFAILDQSTGEFFLGQCEEIELAETLSKFSPSEVLIAESITYTTSEWFRKLKPFITTAEDWIFNYDQSYRILTEHFHTSTLKGFGCDDMEYGIIAAGTILYHIKNTLNSSINHVSQVQPVLTEGILGLDSFTVRNLEIFNSLATQGTHGTLIDILDDTLTSGGGRLLRQWLNRPLTNINILNERLDCVASFVKQKQISNKIRDYLKSISDIERIIGKINRWTVSPREMLALAFSLAIIPDLISTCKKYNNSAIEKLVGQFVDSSKIVTLIDETLNEEVPVQLKSGSVIASGISPELDKLRELSSGGRKWISNFQENERNRTGISNLRVGFNRVFGYYIEVTKSHQHKIPEEYIRKQTLVNSERYIIQKLKEYEEKILNAESQIEEIEERLFNELCQKILNNANAIQINATVFNQIDVLTTFSILALKNNYNRPELSEEPILNLKDGRHPVVEKLLPATDKFIPNDLALNTFSNQIHLITGPNMAGKSTYLRQIGLIVLLAQIGSFVPVRSARIGIVDKLFTRVGASDNLAGGESTFLVEMNEAANILNNASKNSLILLDEIGRGTATFDGLSLAWSITEYLHNHENIAARTLFATHFHELTELEKMLPRLENYHTAVKEMGDRVIFLRKVIKGVGDKSYGIHVARMAGLPTAVLSRATEILNQFLTSDTNFQVPSSHTDNTEQISLFEKQESELRVALSELNIDELTPLEALQKLDDIKKEHGL
ncbi:DNA mismatch repair protein MutS [Candidatus Neomarinimicrobiota bacterium]